MDQDSLFDTNHLLNRARSGDERAVAILYRRYIRRVEQWTRGRVPWKARDLHDTQSVAHDVLVKSLLKATQEGQEIRRSFRSYVQRSVRNRLIDLGTGRRWELRAFESELPSTSPSELENILDREFEHLIRSKIDALPADSRELLHLRFELEMTYGQIRRHLDLPSEDAVRMRINRTIAGLREQIEQAESPPGSGPSRKE